MGEDYKENEACQVKFAYLTKELSELRANFNRNDDWVREIKEAIIKLTMIQESQQEAILAIRESSNQQMIAQNAFLEQLVKDAQVNKEMKEISMKRITIIAGLISTLVATVGTIVVAFIMK